MITNVTYGTKVPIKCADGYKKISGPDAVTCFENTNFYGLDEVSCLGEDIL